MSHKYQRIISFILALVMMLSSCPVVYAEPANNSKQTLGTTTISGTGGDNSSARSGTGYKVELIHITVEGLTSDMSEPARENAIKLAWQNATPNTVDHIGEVVYFTNRDNNIAIESDGIAYNFQFSDFSYGLGDKKDTGTVSRSQSNGKPKFDTIRLSETPNKFAYPDIINGALDRLNITSLGESSAASKYDSGDIRINKEIPMKLGYRDPVDGQLHLHGGENDNVNISNLFMHEITTDEERQADPDMKGTCYATPELAGLINYIATGAGTEPENFIYFKRIYKDGVLKKFNDIVPDGANCFETGYYNGAYGEYRLCVFPYWCVKSSLFDNKVGALTARDYAYLYGLGGSYQGPARRQIEFYRSLCYTTMLRGESIWGLTITDKSVWQGQGKNAEKLSEYLDAGKGGGLSFFTSESMHMIPPHEPNYIGSISHIFLPGSLSDSQEAIESVGMEYIGPKSTEAALAALTKVAISLAKTASGVEQPDNAFSNSSLNTGVLLNGQITLPGLRTSSTPTTNGQFKDTYGYAPNYAGKLIDILNGDENGADGKLKISAETRAALKEIFQEEFNINVDAPVNSSNQANMTDLALAIYILSKYQIDGYETDGTGWGI